MDSYKYARAVNASSNEYEMLLHGIVGWEIEGPAIAAEIKALNDRGASKITLRINSVGGIIQEGLSVVAAILQSKAEIHTFNEGTADSMALVILAAGDAGKRGTYDYGTGIIHDPLIGGVTLEDVEDIKVKTFMQKTKETLVTIFENATGKSRDEISEAMTQEMMLNADELMQWGMVDYIQKSKKQPKITEGATILERMAACTELINNDKSVNMDYKTEFEAVNAKLEAAGAKIAELEAEVQHLGEVIFDKDTLIQDLKAENKEYYDSKVADLVDRAIDSGVYDEGDREFLTSVAEGNVYDFEDMVQRIKAPQVRATDFIGREDAAEDSDAGENRKKWSWEDWEKKDPHGLAQLQYSNPELYDRLEMEDLRKYQGE